MLQISNTPFLGRIALGLCLAAAVSSFAGAAMASSTPGNDVITRPGGRLGGESGTTGYVRPGGAQAQPAGVTRPSGVGAQSNGASGADDVSAHCSANEARSQRGQSAWSWRRLLGSCGH